jgi:TonB family protein
VASSLAEALNSSGATKSIGGVAVGGGGSSGEFSAFYKVIQEQMYQAWLPPKELVGFKQGTAVQIRVAPDGTILEASILTSSGNVLFDQSALAAARKVGKLPQPRPEGCPEFITVNFRLT